MKKKVINMNRTFKIYSKWYSCYMFKSSISLLPDFKFSNLNSRSIKMYKMLTNKQKKNMLNSQKIIEV